MRPRKSDYKRQLEQRIAEAKQAAAPPAPPAPDPLPGFVNPDVRAELLADQLRDVQAEVVRERAARKLAENRAAELEASQTEATSHAGFTDAVFRKTRRRASWK